MKKSIRSIVLLSAVAMSTLPTFAAVTGGNPRPVSGDSTSVMAAISAAVSVLLGV